jgi:mannose-6-phosphate isomerase-like protein (cupin superfamily)
MIQRAIDMETEVREKMREGHGSINITHLLKEVQMKGKCRFFGKMLIKPGCSIGEHRHDNEEEIFYIIKGQGTVVDNDMKQKVTAGDVVLTGNGASHSIENTGSETLEVLGIILLYS